MAKSKKDSDLMSKFSCCMSTCGLVHVIAGAGLGLLLVQYLGLTDLSFWGWLLVAAGVVGHFFWKLH